LLAQWNHFLAERVLVVGAAADQRRSGGVVEQMRFAATLRAAASVRLLRPCRLAEHDAVVV
jgi:hypothetical protein